MKTSHTIFVKNKQDNIQFKNIRENVAVENHNCLHLEKKRQLETCRQGLSFYFIN